MKLPERKRNRLQDYDYGQNGAYFITFCTQNKERLLWNQMETVGEHSVLPLDNPPVEGESFDLPSLSKYGEIVENAINIIPHKYSMISVEKYVIMPNHVHLLLKIHNDDDRSGSTMCTPTISKVVKHLKEYVTKQIGIPIWQRSFHDHVIRNQDDYRLIWDYIDTNPLKWKQDFFYS